MNAKRLVRIAIFVALICVGGLVSVPIPFTAVEISLQVVFVLLGGLVLGGADGALAVLIYIAMGLFGLPVFTQGGGPQYIFMPSFGYMIGFPIGASIAGTLCGRLREQTRGKVFLCALVGCLPIYAIGITYQVFILYYYLGKAWAVAIATVPALGALFIKDAALVGCCASLYPSLMKAIGTPVRRVNGIEK